MNTLFSRDDLRAMRAWDEGHREGTKKAAEEIARLTRERDEAVAQADFLEREHNRVCGNTAPLDAALRGLIAAAEREINRQWARSSSCALVVARRALTASQEDRNGR